MKNLCQTIYRHLSTLMLVVGLIGVFSAQSASVQGSQVAQPIPPIDAATRQQVIEGALKALNDAYVFPETAKKMEQAIRERMQRKEYDDVTDGRTFANRLTQHLLEISHDKHLRVIFNDGNSPFFAQQTADFTTRRRMSAMRN